MSISPDPSSWAPIAAQALNSTSHTIRIVWPSGHSFHVVSCGSPPNPPSIYETKQYSLTRKLPTFHPWRTKSIAIRRGFPRRNEGGVNGSNEGEHRLAPAKMFACRVLDSYAYALSSARRKRKCLCCHANALTAASAETSQPVVTLARYVRFLIDLLAALVVVVIIYSPNDSHAPALQALVHARR